ncbi:HPP family protein [Synechococcus sp. BA-132 BA5]|uniref:HPP family protein n=1 Tax=Synechococcus sp. BA-132 BA5 TaxID=3110252 RepID=UPI003FCCB17D
MIVAPLGASSVLLFRYPRSPLAQPRNVVVGNTLGGILGVAMVALFSQGPLVLALAVGLTILLGQQLPCLHASGRRRRLAPAWPCSVAAASPRPGAAIQTTDPVWPQR